MIKSTSMSQFYFGLPRRTFLSYGCAWSVLGQTLKSPDEVWREFRKWQAEESQSGAKTDPWEGRLIRKLTSEGVPQDEITRRITIIKQKLSDPDVMRAEINEVWRRQGELPGNKKFRMSPSAWLVAAVSGVRPGKALDLGMAQGRNALYLARQGWDVTGVDMSDVAIAQAEATASEVGAKYRAIVADLNAFDFGQNNWDLIASIYEPDWNWAAKIQSGLKSGGLFVRENHAFGPTAARNGLLKVFEGLRIIRYQDDFGPTDYAPTGEPAPKDRVLRLIARKD